MIWKQCYVTIFIFRSTIQTLALLKSKDVEKFGYHKCLKYVMLDLEKLVDEGLIDERTGKILQVRVICSLGDNLENNQICGLLPNFSKMEHCCRKCMASRTILCTAKNYEEIHCKSHYARTNQSIISDFEEAESRQVKHINGIKKKALYFDFPFFDSAKMLPQCSSHDLLGTIHISRKRSVYFQPSIWSSKLFF
jgi:hypothetical protein